MEESYTTTKFTLRNIMTAQLEAAYQPEVNNSQLKKDAQENLGKVDRNRLPGTVIKESKTRS